MAHITVKDSLATHSPNSITSALAISQWGNKRPTEADGLYRSSRQSGGSVLQLPTACKTAYNEPVAKSGTSNRGSLSPTIQQDFTGTHQLTLEREVLRVRLAPGSESELAEQATERPTDARQASFDGAQLPMSSCGAWSVISECESGEHHFAKRLYCGREWCEVCGQDNSASHKRRQARLLPKMQQIRTLGYLVIEFPDIVRHIGARGIRPDTDEGEQVRGWCYSKEDLRDTTNTIVEVIAGKRGAGGRGSKRVGGYFARGVGRWHWFGDRMTGKYNPHFNVLIDFDSLVDDARSELQADVEAYRLSLEQGSQGKKVRREVRGIEMYQRGKSGYMPKPLLDRIVSDLRDALDCPELIVHYSYKDKPGQIVQTVRYITRATFKDATWERYMVEELYNFRNIRWWGSWSGEAAWELEQAEAEGEDVAGLGAVASLQTGMCPDCGMPLKVLHHSHRTGLPVQWTKPIDSVYLDTWGAQEIAGSGYYRIPRQPCSGSALSPEEFIRLQQLEARARQRPSVHPWSVAMRQAVDELWRSTRTYQRMYRRKLLEDMEREFLEDIEGTAPESHEDGLLSSRRLDAEEQEEGWHDD